VGKSLAPALALLAFALAGCVGASRVTFAPPPDQTKASVASTPVTIRAGQTVTTAAGLTVTIPRAVSNATLTTSAPDSEPLRSSDYLLIEGISSKGSSRVVMVYSSVATAVPLAGLNAVGQDTFKLVASGNGTMIYMGQRDFPRAPRRLFAVAGRTSKGRLTVLIFGGSSVDETGSVRAMWRTLNVRGLNLPPGYAG
jgi:hypothetical protein